MIKIKKKKNKCKIKKFINKKIYIITYNNYVI